MGKKKTPQEEEPKFVQVIKGIVQEPLFYVGVFIVILLLCLPSMFSNKEQVPQVTEVSDERSTNEKQAEENNQTEQKEQTTKQEETSQLSKEEKSKYLEHIYLYKPDGAVFVTPNKPVRFVQKGKKKEFTNGTTWIIRANGKTIVAHTEKFAESEIPTEVFQAVQKFAENNL